MLLQTSTITTFKPNIFGFSLGDVTRILPYLSREKNILKVLQIKVWIAKACSSKRLLSATEKGKSIHKIDKGKIGYFFFFVNSIKGINVKMILVDYAIMVYWYRRK